MKPGGRHPKMDDTYRKGKLQQMVFFSDETPKGLKNMLIERRIDIRGMRLDKGDSKTL